jgi:hypothetical protein
MKTSTFAVMLLLCSIGEFETAIAEQFQPKAVVYSKSTVAAAVDALHCNASRYIFIKPTRRHFSLAGLTAGRPLAEGAVRNLLTKSGPAVKAAKAAATTQARRTQQPAIDDEADVLASPQWASMNPTGDPQQLHI